MNVPTVKFYTDKNMDTLWAFVKSILFATAPGVMIWVAISAVGLLMIIIVSAVRKAHKEEDDDEIEVRHY